MQLRKFEDIGTFRKLSCYITSNNTENSFFTGFKVFQRFPNCKKYQTPFASERIGLNKVIDIIELKERS